MLYSAATPEDLKVRFGSMRARIRIAGMDEAIAALLAIPSPSNPQARRSPFRLTRQVFLSCTSEIRFP